MPLSNFDIVTSPSASPGRIFRAAQPDANALATLNALGVDYIIRLNSDRMPLADEEAGLQSIVEYLPLSIIPFYAQAAIAATVRTWALARQGKTVLVHCAQGIDRTGAVVGIGRIMYDGWTIEQVNAERAVYGVNLLHDISDFEIAAALEKLENERGA
jgi:protein tyrosine/serine phosphatase